MYAYKVEIEPVNKQITKINLNNSRKIRRLEVTLKRAQRNLSRKLESHKKRQKSDHLNIGEYGSNIKKAILRVQNLHR